MRHLKKNLCARKRRCKKPRQLQTTRCLRCARLTHLASALPVGKPRHGRKLASVAPFGNPLCQNHRWPVRSFLSDRHARPLRQMRHSEEKLDKGRYLRLMRHLRQLRRMQGDAAVARGTIASYRSSETCRMMCEEMGHFHPSALCAHHLPRLDSSHPPRQPDHALPDCRHQWIDAAFSEPGWRRSSHCSISCGVQFHS